MSLITIRTCSKFLQRIVDDVLALSKIDANLIEVIPVDVQPRSFLENGLKIFNAELVENKIQLDFVVEQSFVDLNIDCVKVDPGRLLQVLINLCTNAIKFTADSPVRTITVSLAASLDRPLQSSNGVAYLQSPTEAEKIDPTTQPDWGDGEQLYLQVQVRDTGRGLSKEDMKLLFQRFSQVSPRTHTKYGGSGLGLFIARLLSQLQGGEIGVSSAITEGTTFAFYVKVRRVIPKETSLPVPIPEKKATPVQKKNFKKRVVESPEKRSFENFNILVVEDNLVNQKVLSRQLRTLGFGVSLANNGKEAIDFVQTTRIWAENDSSKKDVTLILMDIEMPIMNGTEATRLIREYQSQGQINKHIPIIAITANARLEQASVARSAGMDEVVFKPFRIPELLEKIGMFLEHTDEPTDIQGSGF
jgi:CheY-like chemotaxis protein